MQKVLAIMIVLAGIAGGLTMGFVMQPTGGQTEPEMEKAHDSGDLPGSSKPGDAGHEVSSSQADGHVASYNGQTSTDRDYVKIGRQIIIPVVTGGETKALMLFDLALDVPLGMTERTYAAEPRLRDAFLRVLFEMSYTGAFSSTYTDERVIDEMRGKLRATAQRLLGESVQEVLILDIMRQEM